MKTNYHTHTTRCMHATGDDEDYVLSAIKGGYRILGFSDHTPWKYRTDYVADMRMLPEELPGYVESLKTLREKYHDRIDIRIGLECEYFPQYIHWLKSKPRSTNWTISSSETITTTPMKSSPTSAIIQTAATCSNFTKRAPIRRYGKRIYSPALAHPDLFIALLSEVRPPLHYHQPAHLPYCCTPECPVGIQYRLCSLQ